MSLAALRWISCAAVAQTLAFGAPCFAAQSLPNQQSLSQRVANAVLIRWPDGSLASTGAPVLWNDNLGVLLQGVDSEWLNSANGSYFRYVQSSIDRVVAADGSISVPVTGDRGFDPALLGRLLLHLYGVTQNRRYLVAAEFLSHQLHDPSRPESTNRDLDELFMTGPFDAQFASMAHREERFAGIADQLTADAPTAHESHGYSVVNEGWYLAALVDTIEYFPENHPDRAKLLGVLAREAAFAVRSEQHAASRRPADLNRRPGTIVDSGVSGNIMQLYALAKSVRLGYLPARYMAYANRDYSELRPAFEKFSSGDAASVGAFLMAGSEMEVARDARIGRGKTVVMDGWFNSQTRVDAFGHSNEFHYKWITQDDSGFSFFGRVFQNLGATTRELDEEPTLQNLRSAQIYVIVSPDNPAKNPTPHFANAEDAGQIAAWVRRGGVLLIFENDTSFADLDHFNAISEKFGIHFNNLLRKHVEGEKWQQGRIDLKADGPIFRETHIAYVKDVCTISLNAPARAVLADNGDILMATAKYGKGTVYAMVDPWLYNEYTDGRKLPVIYDNLSAGKELARWAIGQIPAHSK